MSAASTWRTSAAVRAIARWREITGRRQSAAWIRSNEQVKLTEGRAEQRTGGDGVILERIVKGAEDHHQDMDKEPGAVEEPTATIVNHPVLEAAAEATGLPLGRRGSTSGRIVALESLQTTTLGFVASEVGRAVPGGHAHVRVGVEEGRLVAEVETRRAGVVVCHGWCL
jgi:hypothetical protein